MKSKVTLKGNKKAGYILTVSDDNGYKDDMAITEEEAWSLFAQLRDKLLLNKLKSKGK